MKRRRFLFNAGLAAASPWMATAQQAGPAGPGNDGGPQERSGRGGRGGMSRGPISERGLQPLDGGKIGNSPPMKIADIKTFLVGAGGRN